jgi:hypothetical protein
VIYNSYGEWLDSDYSKKEIDSIIGNGDKENKDYRSCQDCHMPSSGVIGNTLQKERAACSEANHSFRDFSHNMMERDIYDIPQLVKKAAKIDGRAYVEGGIIKVEVTVTNTGAGHKFPTDSPLRHLILRVEAKDENNTILVQIDGPTIPLWGGVGSQPEDYAGRPGEIYANILKEKDTNLAPTVAYWNPTIPAWADSDTRLIPGLPVKSEYSFTMPYNGDVTITAKLIYRYAFIDLARQKGWPVRDVFVTGEKCEGSPVEQLEMKCETIQSESP